MKNIDLWKKCKKCGKIKKDSKTHVDGDCTVVVEACLMVILVLQRERNEKQKMKSNFRIYFKNASSG